MLDAAIDALRQMFTRPFRSVFIKTLALTLVLLGLVWVVLEKLVVGALVLPYPWLATALSFLTGIGLVIGLAFVVSPVSFLVAGFFFDELAEVVERESNPSGPFGRALPLGQSIWIAVKFGFVALGVNLIALLLLLVPGINAVAFIAANAYLLGRGYFEFAALRYWPLDEVRRLRKAHALELFVAGLILAAFLSIPILNLLTPLFGTAFMVRIHQGIMRRHLQRTGLQPTR